MLLFRQFSLALFVLGLLIATPDDAPADALSLTGRTSILQGQVALVQLQAPQPERNPETTVASLFAGDAGRSFFAPYPVRLKRARIATDTAMTGFALLQGGAPAERVRHLIAAAEAGRAGYDAVNYGATRKPAKRPTDMTIAEIYRWIQATPGQPHAIGRYQFIPSTLRRVVDIVGVDLQDRFSPQVQDALADVLLAEAGFDDLSGGRINRITFMNNLAKIWAGLPNSSGQSHYHGYAGNRATLTWARFEAEMSNIFPS
ncbi:hypothetical protein [Loktanella sp. M215]|uniref:hypothetical protein n=1 Tax=Loktanella sp. M215 TaxID=2675431 RepID=UPI001F47D577|nr:hypothetical protein [Loktanella sp. M215]MCF7701059.1 hypothetical protein [Loktanella sp. M215]